MATVENPRSEADRQVRDSKIHRFCISHEAPFVPRSWYDDCIALGSFQTESQFHVSHLDNFWHDARPLAYGAAGTYVLPIAIEKLTETTELIEISSHRKRILPFPEGIESPSYGYPAVRELDTYGNAELEQKLALYTPPTGIEFLVAQPLHFANSVIGQYADSHYRTDILVYAEIAAGMGVLDSVSRSRFLNTKHFIPGGLQLGIYPRSWLAEVSSQVEQVSRKFLCDHEKRLAKYNSYQIRAVGFLSERLGSYLLMHHLIDKYSNRIPTEVFGYMTVLTQGETNYSVALGDKSRKWPKLFSGKDRQTQ